MMNYGRILGSVEKLDHRQSKKSGIQIEQDCIQKSKVHDCKIFCE